jgi:hypothetical protein
MLDLVEEKFPCVLVLDFALLRCAVWCRISECSVLGMSLTSSEASDCQRRFDGLACSLGTDLLISANSSSPARDLLYWRRSGVRLRGGGQVGRIS